jgi:hypothetical protein
MIFDFESQILALFDTLLLKTGSLLFKKRRGSLTLFFFAPCLLHPIFCILFS